MQPFFFVGSRRSGTTLVCHIINMHPNLYTPFERYIMWILYCLKTSMAITRPHGGALAPILITLAEADRSFFDYFMSDKHPDATRTAFFDAIHNCRKGRKNGFWRDELVAIGEKNPPEYTTPEMQKFILGTFPNAKFIHIVRHPTAAISSAHKGIDISDPKNYAGWVKVEENILEIDANVLTIRYEDLVAQPVIQSHRLYGFLGVSSTSYTDSRIVHNVRSSGNLKYDLSTPNSNSLNDLMSRYGYMEE